MTKFDNFNREINNWREILRLGAEAVVFIATLAALFGLFIYMPEVMGVFGGNV